MGATFDSDLSHQTTLDEKRPPQSENARDNIAWKGVFEDWSNTRLTVFSDPESKSDDSYTYIRIHEVDEHKTTAPVECWDLEGLQEYWENECASGMQIISVFQHNSWSYLDVHPEMMKCLVEEVQAPEEFAEMIYAFRARERETEDAFMGNPFQLSRGHRSKIELGYILKFPELIASIHDGTQTTWSLRKLGILHQYDYRMGRSKLIILHPCYTTAFPQRLSNLLENSEGREMILTHPLRLHLVLIRTYLYNWRPYFHEKEDQVIKQYYHVKTLGSSRELPFTDTHDRLSELVSLEGKFGPLVSILAGMSRVVQLLRDVNARLSEIDNITRDAHQEMDDELSNIALAFRSYQDNVESILARIRSTSMFLSNSISLKDQNSSYAISESMMKQNKVALSDSGTVRIVTVVTMLFLPPTSVSGFFSMGAFFAMQSDSSGRVITSKYIWMYFAVAIPLTVGTLAVWYWRTRISHAARNKLYHLDMA